jgi:phage tail tape-measure protein
MNPFTSQVRANALADLESARRAAIQQTGERATQAKAFGGSRQGVAEALTNAGFARQAGTLGTTLNEQAFNQAVQMQAADLARQQQAQAANQAAGLQGAQLRLAGAGQLGSLAAQQQALRLGGAQAVMGAGGVRQALDQQQMDAIRNIGLQRLGIVQSSLGAQPANLGGIASTPMYSNPAAGALGGALAGAQLGSAIPGVGTAIGAGVGGILGLLGR